MYEYSVKYKVNNIHIQWRCINNNFIKCKKFIVKDTWQKLRKCLILTKPMSNFLKTPLIGSNWSQNRKKNKNKKTIGIG